MTQEQNLGGFFYEAWADKKTPNSDNEKYVEPEFADDDLDELN